MRVSPRRRRRWNNLLILAVILFIGIINLPSIIKSYLIEPPASPYPSLLNPQAELQAMHFTRLSLQKSHGEWQANPPINIEPQELIERWQQLAGTRVDEQTYQSLQSKLGNPHSIEVWYQDQEEPQRITYYQAPQFWLFKNWQNEWIAVSAEAGYLFP